MVRPGKQHRDRGKLQNVNSQMMANVSQAGPPQGIPLLEQPRQAKEVTLKQTKYLDDFRSSHDTKALLSEGYEIDYDRLVGVGDSSAVFLAHPVNAPAPVYDRLAARPLYLPGYDVAVKVVAKKYISSRRPSKTRTGNLQLALALGQTKPENNLLKVIDIFKTPERIFVFMQYCAYGNVISFIRRNGRIPSNLVQKWSSQMAVALSFLHKFHIAHRNYKLENVLIDENLDAKLTGFGLSKFCADLQTKQTVMSKTICGSEPYLAPEMLKEAAFRSYDPKLADVWAFGVGVFLCITRRYPFEADNLRSLKSQQLARRYMERDVRRRIKPQVRELIDMTFIIEPSQRPTMMDICQQVAWLNPATLPARDAYFSHISDTSITPRPANDKRHRSSGQRPAQGPQQVPAQHPAGQRAARGLSMIGGAAEQEPAHNQHRLSPVMPVTYHPTEALPPVDNETNMNQDRSFIE